MRISMVDKVGIGDKQCECNEQHCSDPEFVNYSRQFIQQLQSSNPRPSVETAKLVLTFIKSIVSGFEWPNSKALYSHIKYWVAKIQEVCVPNSYTAEAVALHIKKICKDELCASLGVPQQQENEALTMLNICKLRVPRSRHVTTDSIVSNSEEAAGAGGDHNEPNRSEYQLNIKEALDEFGNELDSTIDNICNQALDHIHTNEFILTMGYSRTLYEFFRNAARKRKFNLIIAECSPSNKGHYLAERLSANPNIDITIIPDSAIFAVMSRVNKVIVNSVAVGVTGNLCAPAGTHTLALAAHTHSVPLLVCCGLYKLVPRFSMISPSKGVDLDGHLPQNPTHTLDYSYAGVYDNNVTIINPTFDDVPGDLVTLFITNIGAHAPNYIYRLMSDMYGERFNLYPKKLV